MTTTAHFLPREITLVMADGASAISTLGVMEVLDVANRVLATRGKGPAYTLRLASVGEAALTTVGATVATVPIAEVAPSHTVIVGGGPDLPVRPWPPELLDGVRRLAASAERVVSICGGAFLLGELGLLDGRRCTTHWLWLDALRARHPAANVEPDAIYTHDGRVWTSAGVSAGIDLALQLVREDLGPRVAQACARALVVFLHRPGGQSQFGAAVRVRPASDDRLRELVAAIVAHPAAPADVPTLARRMGMSPRNFARVFAAQTGATPAAFVARARVDAAQRALADTDASIAQVAADCGFDTESTFRRTFGRIAGVSPAEWRERFSRRRERGSAR